MGKSRTIAKYKNVTDEISFRLVKARGYPIYDLEIARMPKDSYTLVGTSYLVQHNFTADRNAATMKEAEKYIKKNLKSIQKKLKEVV